MTHTTASPVSADRRASLRRLALWSGAALLPLTQTGCAGPQVEDLARERPLLDLREYFNGRVDAWGIFTDRFGQGRRRFTVRIDASWQGDQGVLDEHFDYSDGERQRRIWRLQALPGGRYIGRADDVVGQAEGQTSGNALRWRYTMALPIEGRVWEVAFDDWMYLMDREVLLNRARMSKLGVTLGEVTLSFRRASPLPGRR